MSTKKNLALTLCDRKCIYTNGVVRTIDMQSTGRWHQDSWALSGRSSFLIPSRGQDDVVQSSETVFETFEWSYDTTRLFKQKREDDVMFGRDYINRVPFRIRPCLWIWALDVPGDTSEREHDRSITIQIRRTTSPDVQWRFETRHWINRQTPRMRVRGGAFDCATNARTPALSVW